MRGGRKLKMVDTFPLKYLDRHSIALVLSLLSKRERLLLLVVTAITLILAFLDLIGVLLIGVVGSLAITGISSAQTGNRVNLVLDFLQLSNLDFEYQVAIVGFFSALMFIGKTLISLFLVKKTTFFMARRAAAMSADLVARYFNMPVVSINHRSAQTSIYALTSGVNSIMVGVVAVLVALISDMALLLVMGVGLFIVDPITAISTGLIFSLMAFVLYKVTHERMRKLGERQGMLNIESAQKIYEAIHSYREILVRDRRGFYANQIGNLRYKLADGAATIKLMTSFSKYVLEVALVLVALLLALYQFSTNTAFRAIATISIFIAASTRITPAILRIQQGLLGVRTNLAEAKPTISLIEELSEVGVGEYKTLGLSRSHLGFYPEVNVREITFSYENKREVLKRVNFVTRPGEFIAIVGGSGAGKTTLVDVILGALDADSGSVEISGLSPKQTFSRWPGAVSYVPQDSPIINGTVRENLGLGYLPHEIKDAYCWESLRMASLESFVKSLPHQLDTYVGDRGTRLSGGQRQRLGIARALISSPKLLILDEATSALDGKTELDISEALRGLKGDLTLILIAHRLSTVVDADRIYFMEDGSARGVGTFEELKLQFPEFLSQAKLMGL